MQATRRRAGPVWPSLRRVDPRPSAFPDVGPGYPTRGRVDPGGVISCRIDPRLFARLWGFGLGDGGLFSKSLGRPHQRRSERQHEGWRYKRQKNAAPRDAVIIHDQLGHFDWHFAGDPHGRKRLRQVGFDLFKQGARSIDRRFGRAVTCELPPATAPTGPATAETVRAQLAMPCGAPWN